MGGYSFQKPSLPRKSCAKLCSAEDASHGPRVVRTGRPESTPNPAPHVSTSASAFFRASQAFFIAAFLQEEEGPAIRSCFQFLNYAGSPGLDPHHAGSPGRDPHQIWTHLRRNQPNGFEWTRRGGSGPGGERCAASACWLLSLLGSTPPRPAHSTYAPAEGHSLRGSALATGSHRPSGTALLPSQCGPLPHEEGGRLSSPPGGAIRGVWVRT